MSKSIYHNHHIIPKHAGGTDAPDNIVRLTVAEHTEAHRLLYEKYGRWQDKLAWRAIAGHIGKEEIINERNRQSKLGKKASPETIEKIKKRRAEQVMKPCSEETKKKMRASNLGKKRTEETKKKMSEGQKRRYGNKQND
tara:strand:- start:46 stop:462 length:417 start_codon:yes stop_codon:yes gene_type:complete